MHYPRMISAPGSVSVQGIPYTRRLPALLLAGWAGPYFPPRQVILLCALLLGGRCSTIWAYMGALFSLFLKVTRVLAGNETLKVVHEWH